MKHLLTTALFVLTFATTAVGAESLYVQSKTAKIMATPAFDSKVIGSFKRGERLQIVETNNSWYRVKTGEATGWVNSLNVSKGEPQGRVSLVKESDKDINEEARRRSSALTSAVSARGLTEKERERASSKNDPDYPALEKLEKETKSISEKKVENFNKTGK